MVCLLEVLVAAEAGDVDARMKVVDHSLKVLHHLQDTALSILVAGALLDMEL